MNAFDYFFENTSDLDKTFLLGVEEAAFRDLFRNSLALSEQIREQVGENNNIILISPNNLFFITVYLAVMKSGNTVVPLDPQIEEQTFRYILEVTNSPLVFGAASVQRRLGVKLQTTVDTGSIRLEAARLKQWQESGFDRDRPASLIFTSGSTGTPKGVMLSHKNLTANSASIIAYLKLKPDDRMLVVLPFYYCYGLSLLHTYLRAGGSIVLNNAFVFLGGLLNDLNAFECTGFAGVPSHFQILLRKSNVFKETEFPHLRHVTQAGGKLANVFIDEFRAAHPKIDFIVMYGQTEATSRLSYLPAEMLEEKKGSIGKGIPGVELNVVDKSGVPVLPGETGEIIARGDNVMIGYYRDEEGANNTIRDGWLYTGDLGVMDEDGYIYLTARSREIVKLGGKRVSPKEIEAVILSMNDVVDCTIEAVEDEILGESLKADVVITGSNNHRLTPKMVKAHCRQHLELYKVPQVVEIQDKISISATGKKVKKLSSVKRPFKIVAEQK